MTEEDIQIMNHKFLINQMSQVEMARLHRFAPSGHIYFIGGTVLNDYFKSKFKGMTPEISKAIGWDE